MPARGWPTPRVRSSLVVPENVDGGVPRLDPLPTQPIHLRQTPTINKNIDTTHCFCSLTIVADRCRWRARSRLQMAAKIQPMRAWGEKPLLDLDPTDAWLEPEHVDEGHEATPTTHGVACNDWSAQADCKIFTSDIYWLIVYCRSTQLYIN